jgi:hypothetical protein
MTAKIVGFWNAKAETVQFWKLHEGRLGGFICKHDSL